MALDGVQSENLSLTESQTTIAAMDKREAEPERAQSNPEFDDAGHPHVDNRQADLTLHFTIIVVWSDNGGYHHPSQPHRNLRALPVTDDVLDTLEAELHAPKGVMPAGLFRGLDQDTPTYVVADHTVITHDQLSDEDAYNVVRAMDRHSECLNLAADTFAFH